MTGSMLWLSCAVASALLGVSLGGAPAAARRIKMDVSWSDAKPSRVELQGNGFGTKPFTPSADRYSLEHDFERSGKPPRLVIVYGGVSTDIFVRPHAQSSSMAIILDVKAGQKCDTSVLTATENRAKSNDYHTVLSAAVQSEIILASNSCDSAYAKRLQTVRVESRCRLTELMDFFDIDAVGFSGFDQRIAQCKKQLIRMASSAVLGRLSRALRTTDLVAAKEAYSDLAAIIEDEEWSATLNGNPELFSSLKTTQLRYLMQQLMINQGVGNLTEADFLREQVLEMRRDPSNKSAFESYNDIKLDAILDKNAFTSAAIADPAALVDASVMDVATEPAAPPAPAPEQP